jgi:pSer/pThr/pTyr-binding forkhead associated (FHA) protein
MPAQPLRGGALPSQTMVFGAATAERSAKLVLVRGENRFGSTWRLQAGEMVLGRSEGAVLFPDDDTIAARHARFFFRGPELLVQAYATQNGVFVRLRGPARVAVGDEFVVGRQRLQILGETERVGGTGVAPSGTRRLGSAVRDDEPTWALLRVASDERLHEVYVRHQRLLTLGRTGCDVNFADDGFVTERHAQLSHEGDVLRLDDLKSRNGTFVRVRNEQVLVDGDLLLIGAQVLRVELPLPTRS